MFRVWWWSSLPSYGVSLWNFYMPYGCISGQTFHSRGLGPILVRYGNKLSSCSIVIIVNILYLLFFLFKFSAMVPEYWLTEGGQSATGALLDHIIESHLAAPYLANRAASQRESLINLFYAKCCTRIDGLNLELNLISASLSRHFFVWTTEQVTEHNDAWSEASIRCFFDWRYACSSRFSWEQVYPYTCPPPPFSPHTPLKKKKNISLLLSYWICDGVGHPMQTQKQKVWYAA